MGRKPSEPTRRTIGSSFKVRQWKVDYYFRGFGVNYTISIVYLDDPKIRGWTAQIIRPWGFHKHEYGKSDYYLCKIITPKGKVGSQRVIQGKYLKLWSCYHKTSWKKGDKPR